MVTNFPFEYHVVSSYGLFALTSTRETNCKKSRLTLTRFRVQLVKNTEKLIYLVIRQTEGSGVRKFDIRDFGTISAKWGVL